MPPNPNPSPLRARTALAGTALAALALSPALGVPSAADAAPAPADPAVVEPDTYVGEVEVVRGGAANPRTIKGTVFDDTNLDSRRNANEPGIAGVTVSNGREVVTTDRNGRYSLPVFDNMTVFVTQPAGWQVPVDEFQFAQFSYNHLPEGSPPLKYGGIAPTGPVPKALNFPLAKSDATALSEQSCPIASDTQVYNMLQVGYARDGAVADLAQRRDYGGCGILMLGDNVGDDLSLYPALKDIYRESNGPIRAAMGNHDMDYDAPDPSHRVDTFREKIGPSYFSYDVGQTHFVVLDSIEFPLTPGSRKYAEKVDQRQLDWLAKDLAKVPADRKVVLATHAPLVDHRQVVLDNAKEVYDVLGDREVTVIGGHTHTLESLLPGDRRAEWAEAGIEELPQHQLIAGAVSGDWYSGGLDEQGLPYAFMVDGARPGVMTLDIDGTELRERYTVRGEADDLQLALGVNSPRWREWAEQTKAWRDGGKKGDAPNLGDPRAVPADQLDETWLTADFYAGSTAAKIEVSVDGGDAVAAKHTQPGKGEALNQGWEYSDPFAATRNLLTSGSITQASGHLWRLPLSSDLEPGTHSAKVVATDAYGRQFTDTIRFTVQD
ncbi:calcineurin-like phosphoesterase C-terminal domain-containing protein [Naumannella huperziae]